MEKNDDEKWEKERWKRHEGKKKTETETDKLIIWSCFQRQLFYQ